MSDVVYYFQGIITGCTEIIITLNMLLNVKQHNHMEHSISVMIHWRCITKRSHFPRCTFSVSSLCRRYVKLAINNRPTYEFNKEVYMFIIFRLWMHVLLLEHEYLGHCYTSSFFIYNLGKAFLLPSKGCWEDKVNF